MEELKWTPNMLKIKAFSPFINHSHYLSTKNEKKKIYYL